MKFLLMVSGVSLVLANALFGADQHKDDSGCYTLVVSQTEEYFVPKDIFDTSRRLLRESDAGAKRTKVTYGTVLCAKRHEVPSHHYSIAEIVYRMTDKNKDKNQPKRYVKQLSKKRYDDVTVDKQLDTKAEALHYIEHHVPQKNDESVIYTLMGPGAQDEEAQDKGIDTFIVPREALLLSFLQGPVKEQHDDKLTQVVADIAKEYGVFCIDEWSYNDKITIAHVSYLKIAPTLDGDRERKIRWMSMGHNTFFGSQGFKTREDAAQALSNYLKENYFC